MRDFGLKPELEMVVARAESLGVEVHLAGDLPGVQCNQPSIRLRVKLIAPCSPSKSNPPDDASIVPKGLAGKALNKGGESARRMAAILTSYHFESAKEVAAFLGLVPVQRESGTSVRGRSRLSKAGNPRVRASLYMAAVIAKKINPDIKALYDRLCAQGKTKMSALGACMRKLVHLCYGVMKSGRDYEFPTPKSA